MKIGDCVITIKEDMDNYSTPLRGPFKNTKGRIIYMDQSHMPRSVLVEFFSFINGHNGPGAVVRGKNGHCWWMYENNLTIIGRYKSNYND